MPKEKPKFSIFDPVEDISKKFGFYINIVISILVVAVLTMLFMVGGLLLDSLHYNSAIYKEYSEKYEILQMTQKSNQELMEANRINQEILIEHQKQIKDLLNKK